MHGFTKRQDGGASGGRRGVWSADRLDWCAVTEALAVAAALIALAFAMGTYERWLRARRPQDLSWTISLGFFTLGAGALAWGAASEWSPGPFRAFYLFGAILNVPYLALGQVQLLAGPRRARGLGYVRRALDVGAGICVGVLLTAPLKAPVRGDALPQGSEVFGVLPRVLAAVTSGVGATIVFGGAAWSTVSLLRARGVPGARRRALGTAVIALGTIVLSTSGLLNSVVGAMKAFSITLTAGVTLLFAGFLLSSSASSSPPRR